MSKWRRDKDREYVSMPSITTGLLRSHLISKQEFLWLLKDKSIPFSMRARLINQYRRQ